MILVLAGTSDGRDLAAALAAAGCEVLASAATSYGAALLRTIPGIAVREGRLEEAALRELLQSGQAHGLLDATHPFATVVSRLAEDAARDCGVPYLRWERPPAVLPDSPLAHRVPGWPEAAALIKALGARRLFMAVGVKPLEFLLPHPALAGRHVTVRVLPAPESLDACFRLGLRPEQIIACQGPGTIKLNEALLDAYGAEALVIKESGAEGGTAEKVQAALNLRIPVVVVGRPAPAAEEREQPPAGVLAGVAQRREEVLDWAAGLAGTGQVKGSITDNYTDKPHGEAQGG